MTDMRIVLCGTVSVAALLAWLAAPLIPESSPVARGAAYARPRACIDCHGRPVRNLDDFVIECAEPRADTQHPEYTGKCEDLLAYFETVRLKRTFDKRINSPDRNRLLQGEVLARQYHCFNCHGELGQGGFRNAGALKGYIPGYFGNDFALLTRQGLADSVRAWIRQGIDPALLANPIEGRIAGFFIARQEVGMPIFDTLPDSSIEILTDYVINLNAFGAMDAKAIRAYGLRTQLPPGEDGT